MHRGVSDEAENIRLGRRHVFWCWGYQGPSEKVRLEGHSREKIEQEAAETLDCKAVDVAMRYSHTYYTEEK